MKYTVSQYFRLAVVLENDLQKLCQLQVRERMAQVLRRCRGRRLSFASLDAAAERRRSFGKERAERRRARPGGRREREAALIFVLAPHGIGVAQ